MKRLVVGYEILSLRYVNTSVEGWDWLQTEANIKVLLYFTFQCIYKKNGNPGFTSHVVAAVVHHCTNPTYYEEVSQTRW